MCLLQLLAIQVSASTFETSSACWCDVIVSSGEGTLVRHAFTLHISHVGLCAFSMRSDAIGSSTATKLHCMRMLAEPDLNADTYLMPYLKCTLTQCCCAVQAVAPVREAAAQALAAAGRALSLPLQVGPCQHRVNAPRSCSSLTPAVQIVRYYNPGYRGSAFMDPSCLSMCMSLCSLWQKACIAISMRAVPDSKHGCVQSCPAPVTRPVQKTCTKAAVYGRWRWLIIGFLRILSPMHPP